VFVGRLSAEKGLDTLLKAWRILEGRLSLKILGDGPLAPMVREAAASHPAIQWLGSQPLESVYAVLDKAICLVLPSQCYEGFPRVVVEAFAKGLPVVASNLGAMAEVVTHECTGLHFTPGDPVDLVAQVQWLLSNPLEQQRMSRAARREYEDKYTVAANYRALMAIYELALHRSVEEQAQNGLGQPRYRELESSPVECQLW
jgi:glycosyltransferase involved in cell wall biosynthesis